jgi:hypothetical protein
MNIKIRDETPQTKEPAKSEKRQPHKKNSTQVIPTEMDALSSKVGDAKSLKPLAS